MMRIRFLRMGGTTLALAAALACDSTEPDEIDLADITRTFTAQTLTTTTSGVTTDHLARGATLTITLNGDRTTTGRLFVPGGAVGGGNLDVSLAGTFTFNAVNDEVLFDQPADTFVRDMTFVATRVDGEVRLVGEEAFGSTTVRAVLR